jgi:ubiquinone/menaquinone biosynthesis C-methylase UbiE
VNGKDEWSLSGQGPETYEQFQVPSTFEPLARRLLDRVRLKRGQKVLDVACGTGVVARLAAAIVGNSGDVVGIDFNAGMLGVAEENTPPEITNIVWLQGDASALTCDDAEFDVVICQQGLQFFPDKIGALREMHRVLASDGRVWLAVWRSPEHSPINYAFNEVLGRYLGSEIEMMSRAPFALGDADELRSLLVDAGFHDIAIEAAGISRHMLPPETSIPALLTSLPFGPQIAALDEMTRSSIVGEISDALAVYRTDEGFSVPQGTHIVSTTVLRRPVESAAISGHSGAL